MKLKIFAARGSKIHWNPNGKRKPLKPVPQNQKPERKFFTSNYEKYEYLNKKQDITEIEQAWILKYRAGNEYKLIYEAE